MSLLRNVVDSFSRSLGKIRRNQRCTDLGNGIVKTNLGCGLAIAPNWINVDGSLNTLVANMPKFIHRVAYKLAGASKYYTEEDYCRLIGNNKFIHHDLSFGVPFNDNSVDYIYSSHFLEHLFLKEAKVLLKDSLRSLKPSGVIRISVPDLKYAIHLYNIGDKKEMLEYYFFVNDDESYFAKHKYMYDFSLLSDLLKEVGFRQIKECKFQEGMTPDLQILDNRAHESLFIEAIK